MTTSCLSGAVFAWPGLSGYVSQTTINKMKMSAAQ
ncbi:hypothetical protein M2387_003643 [Klebsiella sp. BIGb0407]|nr:hypothetical protein [Klebsiella sp. BIGb0407]